MTPQERADRVAAAMWAEDSASKWLGMTVDAIGPGHATLSLVVQPDHVNGHGICHGGVIFSLADSAFAYACNSYNAVTVAQENTVTFLSPGREGEHLIAEAVETARQGRSGVYDVRVTGEDGRTIAVMRGLSRTINGQSFDEDAPDVASGED